MDRNSHTQSALIERRRLLGLTQEGLEDRCGVPRTHISAIENGKYRPNLETAAKLAAALDWSLDELAEALGVVVEHTGAAA